MTRPLPLLLVLAACGGPTETPPADSDSTPPVPVDTFVPGADDSDVDTDAPPIINPSESCKVPSALGLEGACDLSVGAAEIYVDTVAPRPLGLEVRTSGAGSPGGFNGDGLGHRAIAGFHGYDKVPLKDLGGLEIVGEKAQGTFQLVVGLQVDLDCGTRDLHLIEASLDRVVDTVAESGGRTRWRLPMDGPIWTASEAIAPGGDVLLEKTTGTGAQGRALLGVLDAYPDACLRNVDGGFPDLPRRTVASGVILAVGSRVTYGQGGLWKLTEVRIGDDVHLPPG